MLLLGWLWIWDHVSRDTGTIYELHWLPIADRIKFKLCLLVHHWINGRAPSYLTKLVKSVANVPGRASLYSAGRHDLVDPRSRRLVSSEWAFSVAAPWARNSLPVDIRLISNYWHQTVQKDTKNISFQSGLSCNIPVQCRIYIPCSLSLRLLGSLRGSLGTYGLTQKLLKKKKKKNIPMNDCLRINFVRKC